jgi:hypothetical protein
MSLGREQYEKKPWLLGRHGEKLYNSARTVWDGDTLLMPCAPVGAKGRRRRWWWWWWWVDVPVKIWTGKKNGKVVPLINYLSTTPWRRMGSGGIEPLFLTSALDGGECSAWSPGRFIPGETDPGLRSRKPRLTDVGIRCADDATPSIRKSWH